jgi:predicted transcriptional regulator
MPASCGNPRCTCDPCKCVDCQCGYGAARLGELERRVMDILWRGPGEARSIRSIADELPGYAYTTIATLLTRLARKGQVRKVGDGRTHRYAPAATAAAYAATTMREALDDALDPAGTLEAFVAGLPAHELELLRLGLRRSGAARPTGNGTDDN